MADLGCMWFFGRKVSLMSEGLSLRSVCCPPALSVMQSAGDVCGS